MLEANSFIELSQIRDLEEKRNSRVIVFAASNLEIELLPDLYETLLEMGHVKRLDVVLYCRGGIVNAARRIALLLHEFTDHLSFIVPHYCESSSTILVLSAHEIIAGSMAIFSPIDPHLQSSDPSTDGSPMALSAEDIRLFGEMSKDWFGLEEQEAQAQSLSLLCSSIFPATLTSFYRSTLELQAIGKELLAFQLPEKTAEIRLKIVDQLVSGYHSHSYALTRDDMLQLGLKITREPSVEEQAWRISCELRGIVGGALRQSADDSWNDVLIATRDRVNLRERKRSAASPQWKTVELKA